MSEIEKKLQEAIDRGDFPRAQPMTVEERRMAVIRSMASIHPVCRCENCGHVDFYHRMGCRCTDTLTGQRMTYGWMHDGRFLMTDEVCPLPENDLKKVG